jgi:hypothetical protein
LVSDAYLSATDRQAKWRRRWKISEDAPFLVRVLWQGAEYRGRGRETLWDGKLAVTGNRIARFAPVNFLDPERQVEEFTASTALRWTSVTTGNLAGIDLWLDEAHKAG